MPNQAYHSHSLRVHNPNSPPVNFLPSPLTPQDFLPDLVKDAARREGKEWKQREAPKPLHVVQPEGVSFKINGHVLEWQKWRMHIAFNHHEGIALSTITYEDDGILRPLFYRLSLAEMVVPYSAPEHPHTRKFAFDVGEYGMGMMANKLSLGCDRLGQIHYLVQDRMLSHANEGARTWDALADRHWRIVSMRKRHHTSGQLEYSIGVKGGATVALLWPEGSVGRRAMFARNTLWVVREKEDMREGGWMWPWVSRG